jgi:hypothetical protein
MRTEKLLKLLGFISGRYCTTDFHLVDPKGQQLSETLKDKKKQLQ